ncbi:MAG: transposase [Chloracidobacterium sp.]|nr:transposase [Chloracidobacterium sp.]
MEVSAGVISQVTDEVLDDVKAWQARPLEKIYPILWLDRLRVVVNQDGRVSQR